ncbi:C40 family peptidase [Streptomyces sp. SP18CS02]|uniref:C40 family peptidase n=1 Tax=Streptomyces sp. SP18CS02 TaxID=3002531 RepID=UPI002E77014F|nr:C40 family peptidase [Streptomyces sp. SP18CS02]MEE1757231.1 C40 family peptidase [Streptomyces sp. SP18CS02]
MSDRLRRSVRTAAMAAATVLAAVPAVPATAAPAPAVPSAPATADGEERGAEESAAAPAAATTLPEMLARLRTLYQRAEEASEAYNAAEEQLKAHTAGTRKLTVELAKVRDALERGRIDAGRLARAQYRGRLDFSPALQLLLARDPDHALDEGHLVRRASREQAASVARLEGGEQRAERLATAARRALDRERVLVARQKKARDDVTARLKEVERTLASLSPDEAGELARLESAQTAGAQSELLATGRLDGERTPSEEGDEALAYAARQIGKPYVWGAEGPESFDCSGLTSRAWASAGRTIPRTSQEQWRTLPRVPLRSLRPGDLVVYFPKATHVAIYLGEGLVIQAPRPGARVKVSPIAANPLLGAVRPDPSARPLASYTPPELPSDAAAGSDEGYDGFTKAPGEDREGPGAGEGDDPSQAGVIDAR